MLEGYACCRMLFDHGRPHDFLYLDVNPAFEKLTGLKNVIGKKVSEVIPGIQGALPELFEVYGRVALTGKTERIEVHSDQFGGWLSISVYSFEKGSFVAVFDNITERKQAEEALRESELRFRLVAETIEEIFCIVDILTERMLYVSPGYERVWGCSLKKLYDDPQSFLDAVHPEDCDRVSAVLERRKKGEPVDHDYRIVRLDGSVRWIWERGYPVQGEAPSPHLYVAVAQDITEHKLNDERLRESERDYRNLVDNALVGVYRSSLEGKFLYVNSALATMFEFSSAAEMLQEDVFRRYKNSGDRDKFIQDLRREGRISNYELEAPTKSGRSVHLLLSAVLSGDIICGMALDVSEKKKLERQLQQAQKMEAVGQLTGGIAHDFNNILSAITGYASLLQRGIDESDPLRNHLDQILSSANKAAELTRSLLTFSRQQITNLIPIDVNESIGKIETLLARTIGEDIIFRTIPVEKDLTVNADPGQVEQVLMNLAMNARDAMPGGGQLTIETRSASLDEEFSRMHGYGKPGEYALITVTDTGTGMDEHTRRRIFEPFFTTKEPGKGTGLGLSMVYGIVKKHEGFINVYSEPGRGTCFKLYLPLTDLPAKKIELRERGGDGAVAGGAETVLVAEDDEALRKLNSMILRHYGYSVVEAADGQEAIEKFIKQKEQIRLLVLDGIMPRKSGKEAYREISALHPGIRTIILSGYAESIFEDREMRERGVIFNMKPIMPKDLARTVRELLDRPQGNGKA
jgi:PAS domain S-box-containing protein